jgi:hypothetical protein
MLESVRQIVENERSYEGVMRTFGEILQEDPELQARLDQVVDKDEFARLYVELGTQKGYEFSLDQMLTVMQEQRQGSNWVLPRCAQIIMRGL